MQRKFIIGDEWLYFKIYSGPKTLESILLNEIYLLVNELMGEQVIDKFFFIRYVDPDCHLRIRFHLPDVSKLAIVIQLLNRDLKYYVDNRLVWKFCTDTYNRELERYGSAIIEEMETLFSFDSIAIMKFLHSIEETGLESFRWLWGIKCMDALLEHFGLSLADKVSFYSNLNDGYSKEFDMNKSLKLQLNKRYRNERVQIKQVVELKENNVFPGIEYIYEYIQNVDSIVQNILNISKNNNLEIPLNYLLSSIIHVHFNRLFRTKQRMHEFVIYFLMNKFYRSQMARLKYNPVTLNLNV